MFDLDAYDRSARLAPAYLVFSPAVVLVVALSLGSSAWWSKIGGALAGCGAPILAVQWGRSGGSKKQAQLWAKWGGAPTTKLLRFAEGETAAAVAQRHEEIERATDVKMPSAEQENADPAGADAIYETGVTALRALTDDGKQFPLVLKESIAYGFRRYLWGCKPYGIGVAAAVLAITAGLLIAAAFGHAFGSWPAAGAAGIFAIFALLIWLAMVKEEWVHEAADSYATRLMQTAVRLPSRHKRGPRATRGSDVAVVSALSRSCTCSRARRAPAPCPGLRSKLRDTACDRVVQRDHGRSSLGRSAAGPGGGVPRGGGCRSGERVFYYPVELDHPHLLAKDGLSPSESNPQFHQQMVYAVAMTTIQHFERALGRKALWADRRVARKDGSYDTQFVRRLRIYPHALREGNAYYSPSKKALLFGY